MSSIEMGKTQKKTVDLGFHEENNKGLVSTHNLVKPRVTMTAKDLKEVREKFVAAAKAKTEVGDPKGGKK